MLLVSDKNSINSSRDYCIIISGADSKADDGVYSAYFYQYNGDGVYSVRAFAQGVSGQTEILRETRELLADWDTGSYNGNIIITFPI